MASHSLMAFSMPTMPLVPWWTWTLLVAACTVATVTDLRSMRIPNWLTLPLLVTGLIRGGLMGGPAGAGDALAGAAFAGFIFVAAYILVGGGAGDAKLMLGLGSWIGLDPSLVLVMAVTLAGFMLAMYFTVVRGGWRDVPIVILHGFLLSKLGYSRLVWGRGPATRGGGGEPEPVTPRERPKNWFPYAPAILVGTLVAWWYCSTFRRVA